MSTPKPRRATHGRLSLTGWSASSAYTLERALSAGEAVSAADGAARRCQVES